MERVNFSGWLFLLPTNIAHKGKTYFLNYPTRIDEYALKEYHS